MQPMILKDYLEQMGLGAKLIDLAIATDSVEAKKELYECLGKRYEILTSILAIADNLPLEQELELIGNLPREEIYQELYTIDQALEKGLV